MRMLVREAAAHPFVVGKVVHHPRRPRGRPFGEGALSGDAHLYLYLYLSAHIRHAVATGVGRRIREAPSSSGTLREGSVRAWQPLPACSERRLAPPCTLWKDAPPTLSDCVIYGLRNAHIRLHTRPHEPSSCRPVHRTHTQALVAKYSRLRVRSAWPRSTAGTAAIDASARDGEQRTQ